MSGFEEFRKIPRFNRHVTITEKIDGTNAQILITEEGEVRAGSRTRWITPEEDNFGFAAWVRDNADGLREELGEGRHYGEWWGQKIQRAYGLSERRFSLFNTNRWNEENLRICHVVPVLYEGIPSDGWSAEVNRAIEDLRENGSYAAPGFMKPEGIVTYHKASDQLFKATLERDEEYKGKRP